MSGSPSVTGVAAAAAAAAAAAGVRGRHRHDGRARRPRIRPRRRVARSRARRRDPTRAALGRAVARRAPKVAVAHARAAELHRPHWPRPNVNMPTERTVILQTKSSHGWDGYDHSGLGLAIAVSLSSYRCSCFNRSAFSILYSSSAVWLRLLYEVAGICLRRIEH